MTNSSVTKPIEITEPESNVTPKEILSAISKFLIFILVIFTILNTTLKLFVLVPIEGASMEPTYTSGQKVFMVSTRLSSEIERGDIVVVRVKDEGEPYNIDGRNIIKRVIGLPGDCISYDAENHHLMINGVIYNEPYLTTNEYYWGIDTVYVPEGRVFVMGDNRGVSIDSRACGSFDYSQIRGKVITKK